MKTQVVDDEALMRKLLARQLAALGVVRVVACERAADALDILTHLRLKHVGLSIDDFGTGHSSLAQLRDIPFSELKIDRGFVLGAWQDAALRPFFNASLGMARQLGMKTVAEGVEDREDWDFVRATGCDLGQGWFIAKPMPPAALQDWIVAWESRRRELPESAA